jgi:peptide/nickel transport system permease protein
MLAAAQPYADRAPLGIIAPGLAIFTVALCVTLIGQRAARMAAGPLLLPTGGRG